MHPLAPDTADSTKAEIDALRGHRFVPSAHYTRGEIHARVGGSTVACLPMRDGAIVAACLTTEFSPRAPEVVLCGQGVRTGPVSALFARQRHALPVFIKSAANRWQYRGRFVVTQALHAGATFESWITGSGRSLDAVSHVVFLRRVE